MKRVVTKIGDVFSVPLENSAKKYFQYIANDRTQLDSDVIRTFKKAYPIDGAPDFREIVSGEVDFYAHVIIKLGVKMGLWKKVGSVPYHDAPRVVFRHSWDWGKPGIKVSQRWSVWKINEDFQNVGKLEGELQKAEIGIVFSPPSIVDRMRTGLAAPGYPRY